MVLAGEVGAEASRGTLSPLAIAGRALALSASAAVLLIVGRSLRPRDSQTD
jgi:hypothetical protein